MHQTPFIASADGDKVRRGRTLPQFTRCVPISTASAITSPNSRLRCYDHLAGQLGVAVTQGLQERGFIAIAANKQFQVNPAGVDWFNGIGLDVSALRPTRRGLARQCLDWTERSHHLAGPLGVALLAHLCSEDWLKRSRDSGAVRVTPKGRTELKRQLGVDL